MSNMDRFRAAWVGLLALSFPVVAIGGHFTSPVGTVGTVATLAPMGLDVAPGVIEIQSSPGSAASRPSAAKPKEAFGSVKSKADRVTSALDAVVIWQAFIDNDPAPEDKAKAEEEMKVWQERVDDDAALINRKWVGGKEKKQIEERVKALIDEYQALSKNNQTIAGIEKLKEAAKLWPENYVIQFNLGFFALDKRDLKEATQKFEACLRLAPNSPEVLNNLGVCYMLNRTTLQRGIQLLTRSVKIKDSKENVQNLLTALASLPGRGAQGPQYKEAREAVSLLGSRYQVQAGAVALMQLPRDGNVDPAGQGGKDQVVGNGSGFIISEDGLILTNKHVAGAGSGVMIKFNDGTQKTGEIVVIDDEQDLALIRVKSDAKLPYVKFAKYDNPPDGMNVIVMGFPLVSKVGFAMKTTKGIVSAGNNEKMTSDVTLDARVNPGNSGGPVYNEFANIVAIIAQKTISSGGTEDTYGLAISNGRIHRFLKKNNINLEPADEDGATPLSVQQVAERNRMATVCILIVGKPSSESDK